MPPTPEPLARLVPHVTCLACGCLCDDITATVVGQEIVAAERACRIGLPWFLAPHPGDGIPSATIEGQAVNLESAIDRAATLLREARSPVIWGLTGSSVEAVAEAVALADRLGATVDLAGSAERASQRAAFVRMGAVSATLGEIKDRAGVVLCWGGHPDASHPRHAERYSIHPQGRFLNQPRTVIVVDVGPAEAVGSATLRVSLTPERQGEALAILRARARGVLLDPARVEQMTGQPLAVWDAVLEPFRSAPVAAILFGPAAGALDPTGWDAALGLVRDLNREGRRCVGLNLGEPGNVAGAESVLCWQAGAASSIDFAAGWPRHLPAEATLAARLRTGEADVVLAIGSDLGAHWPADVASIPGRFTSILVGPGACTGFGSGSTPQVAIDSARVGIESGGTVARVDGVMLPLRPPLDATKPSDHSIIQALAHRLTAGAALAMQIQP